MTDLVRRLRAGTGDTSADVNNSNANRVMREAADEIERLRLWIAAIGGLSDVDADDRSWMAAQAMNGRQPPVRGDVGGRQ